MRKPIRRVVTGHDQNNVAKAINDQSWQPIRLAIHQSIEWLRVHSIAQRQRYLEPMHKQSLAWRPRGIASDYACTNKCCRIDIGKAQKLIPVRAHLHDSARLESRDWRCRDIDFIGKYPLMTGIDAAIFTSFEAEDGQLRLHDGKVISNE